MDLKDKLIRKGYFPENLPPSFSTDSIADYFQDNPAQSYLTTKVGTKPYQFATYNSSKRGISRRVFSVIHPGTAHDLAQFVSSNWGDLEGFFSKSKYSLSVPDYDEEAERALVISSFNTIQQEKISRLSPFRFIVTTDIARFYHSIYTHSIPWAYYGKEYAKSTYRRYRRPSAKLPFDEADAIIRNGQDGQTIGIPVGPDVSRVFAELIGTAIDFEFKRRIGEVECAVLRYIDDVWIGVNSHADAEKALACYQSAVREFELDVNESKTGIYSENFSFLDSWPIEIAEELEQVKNPLWRKNSKDRLRATLETSFSMAVKHNDEGVLKYTLRCIDRNQIGDKHWEVVEPFLKRVSVHYGHTIDYVARILVYRHLKWRDLDVKGWRTILEKILDYHGSLGHDSEVCWLVYLNKILGLKIHDKVAENIVSNCGALSVLAVLNSVDDGLVDRTIFENVWEHISSVNERNRGRLWPVILEWKSRKWPKHDQLKNNDEILQNLIDCEEFIYDSTRLPKLFDQAVLENFEDVEFAIESSDSFYNDDESDNELDDED